MHKAHRDYMRRADKKTPFHVDVHGNWFVEIGSNDYWVCNVFRNVLDFRLSFDEWKSQHQSMSGSLRSKHRQLRSINCWCLLVFMQACLIAQAVMTKNLLTNDISVRLHFVTGNFFGQLHWDTNIWQDERIEYDSYRTNISRIEKTRDCARVGVPCSLNIHNWNYQSRRLLVVIEKNYSKNESNTCSNIFRWTLDND